MKIINVVGARPNFMKIAPIMKAMGENGHFKPLLLHTGQHYDYEMSKVFFDEFKIVEPEIHLGVGSGTHAEQTGKIMIEFEKVLLQENPELILLVGDVNSTLACALASSKLSIPFAHVEAGLRCFDRTLPEEINRVVTDSLAEYLFTPTKSACDNLAQEGISDDKIHFVGNIMIDTLFSHLEKANNSGILDKLNLKKKNYAVLTLHRPENVDSKDNLLRILPSIDKLQKKIPIVYPVHRRTKQRLEEFDLERQFTTMKNLRFIDPLGYSDFIKLEVDSIFVMTDSGGIQEETTVLKIPCLTLRKTTERPETVSTGTNILVGSDPERIISESLSILDGKVKSGNIPEYWDGKTGARIINILAKKHPV
jgi:UDP-N-acetylglucosamine 2-epimerase (non-hydrolysing)